MKPSPISKDDVTEYLETRRSLEADFMGEVTQSRKTAWNVAKGAGLVAAFSLALAGFVVFRYAQPIPEHILTVNRDTGEAQVVSLMRNDAKYNETIDSFWCSQFVIHHESYDYWTGQADYDAVGLMSTSGVAEEYKKKFSGKEAMNKVLRDAVSDTVDVKSVMVDEAHQIATVRYKVTRVHHDRDTSDPPRYYIATLAYEYVNLPMTAAQRYINPLGFRVVSWRRVEESAGQVGE